MNPADAPILTLALSSTTLPLTQVEDVADTRMGQKISQIAGVGLVTLSGGQRPAVRIQANPRALASYGLSMESLRTAIASANVNGSKGSFDGPTRAYTINANDQLTSACRLQQRRRSPTRTAARRCGCPTSATAIERVGEHQARRP